jgi:uncharacterized protein YraI
VNNPALVNSTNVNVRSDPGTNYNSVGTITRGNPVTVYEKQLGTDGYWYRINSSQQWVRGDFLAPNISNGGASDYLPGDLGVTTAGATIFKAASVSDDNMGVFHAGCKFIIEGETGSFVKIKFGNSSGTSTTRYVRKSEFAHLANGTPPVSTVDRMVTIARSLVGVNGNNLGTPGEYCQLFLYWLIGASGRTKPSSWPSSGYAADGLATLESLPVW